MPREQASGQPPTPPRTSEAKGGEDNDVYGPLACHKQQGHRRGEDSKEYGLVSYGSGHTADRETNLLAGAQQRETQDGGRATHEANRRGGKPPQRVLGVILNKIDNNKSQGKQKGYHLRGAGGGGEQPHGQPPPINEYEMVNNGATVNSNNLHDRHKPRQTGRRPITSRELSGKNQWGEGTLTKGTRARGDPC